MVLGRLRGEINSYVLNYTDPDNCCSVSLFFCNSCHNFAFVLFSGIRRSHSQGKTTILCVPSGYPVYLKKPDDLAGYLPTGNKKPGL